VPRASLIPSFKPSLQHYPKNRVSRAGFEPRILEDQEKIETYHAPSVPIISKYPIPEKWGSYSKVICNEL
jgi:hypothetical protein